MYAVIMHISFGNFHAISNCILKQSSSSIDNVLMMMVFIIEISMFDRQVF